MYALIEENKVANIISLLASNAKDFPNAVNCDGLPVNIGDDYINGNFYHDGALVVLPVEEKYIFSIGEIVEEKIADFIAANNYDMGLLLMINGEAYETIKAIPRGKTIRINEDVVKTTITKYMEEKE